MNPENTTDLQSTEPPPPGPLKMTASYRVGWLASRALFGSYFRWRIYHPERVPASGPVILAANHASFLDPPLVGAGLTRPLNYLARESLFHWPGCGRLLRSWNAVPVDRDGGGAAGLRAILDRLLAGGGIVVFPEGTRTSTGELLEGKTGVALAVLKSEAPVVPVRIFGSFDAMGRHHILPRPKQIIIKYGEPMLFETERSEARTCPRPRLKQLYHEVAAKIMRAIGEMKPGLDR